MDPTYVRVPVYVTDQLERVVNMQCKLCSKVVIAEDARRHYFKECERLVVSMNMPLPEPALEGEVCIGVVEHGIDAKTCITNYGRLYRSNLSGQDLIPLNNNRNPSVPLASGIQWIVQQQLKRMDWRGRIIDLQNMLEVMIDVERFRRDDFGLQHEQDLNEQIQSLEERSERQLHRIGYLEDQRSRLRTDVMQAETRCEELMMDLASANSMVEQMQEEALRSHPQCAPSGGGGRRRSRKRRKPDTPRPENHTGFDGQPPTPVVMIPSTSSVFQRPTQFHSIQSSSSTLFTTTVPSLSTTNVSSDSE
jgi:hypothetical protein